MINTGWMGGPYGIGKRINLKYTRKMVAAAVNENLNNVQYRRDQIFNLDIPLTCPDIPPELLDPSSTLG